MYPVDLLKVCAFFFFFFFGRVRMQNPARKILEITK